jgi:hypothetical protein
MMAWTRLIPRIFMLLCTLIGSIALGEYAIFRDQGYFDPWTDLGTPGTLLQPGEKADKIIGYGIGFIRVGTNQNRAFQIDLRFHSFLTNRQGELEWADAPYRVEVREAAHFGCPFIFRVPTPSGMVIDSAQMQGCRLYVGMEQANYALLENGEVWVWEKSQGVLEHSNRPVIFAWILGGGLGFIFGSMAVFTFKRLALKGSRA